MEDERQRNCTARRHSLLTIELGYDAIVIAYRDLPCGWISEAESVAV
jgi:hypothetical protein